MTSDQGTDYKLQWLNSRLTSNQSESFMNIIPEVMCNVPEKDCVKKNTTMARVYN